MNIQREHWFSEASIGLLAFFFGASAGLRSVAAQSCDATPEPPFCRAGDQAGLKAVTEGQLRRSAI